MRPSFYTYALYELLQDAKHKGNEDKLVEHTVGTIRANGHAHMLPKVARALERIAAKRAKETTITVTSADDITQEEVLTLLKKEPFKHLLSGEHKKVVRKTDPSIVGGTIVRTHSERTDASYKRMLLDLYQSTTAN